MSTLWTPPTTASPPGSAGPPAPPAEDAASPLSPHELDDLADAQQRARRLLRAARLAGFNGWATGIFAALSLPFGIFSPPALVMGLLLAFVAFNEFRGRRLLLRFDLRGPRVLGLNQLLLMAVLIGYSLWRIHGALTGPSPYEAAIATTPDLAGVLEPIGRLYVKVTLAIYGSLIAFSAIFQGLAALYYFRCARRVESHLRQTPPWIVDAQRTWARS